MLSFRITYFFTYDICPYEKIRSVLREYNCDVEYLQEFNEGKMLEYSLLQSVLPRNKLIWDIEIEIIEKLFTEK